MDNALGDALAVEARDLLDELAVLQHRGAALTDGSHALVIVDRVVLSFLFWRTSSRA